MGGLKGRQHRQIDSSRMPQHARNTGYNNTQKYFLVTDTLVALFWFFVLARLAILYPLTGSKFLAGGLADFYLGVLVATETLELFNYVAVFRHIPGTQTAYNALPKPHPRVLLSVAGSRLVLAFVFFNYPRVARSGAFALVVLVQSVKEFFRWFYNLQKVRLYSNVPRLFRFCRSLTYLVCTPVEAIATVYLVFQSLVFPSYQDQLQPYDAQIKAFLKILLFAYLPTFYLIYKRTVSKYFFAQTSHRFTKPAEKVE